MATSEDNSSAVLVVEKSEAVLVKPSKPTPHVSLSLSTLDNNPLIEDILQNICVFAPNPYLKDQTTNHDLASLLQHALSNALVYYYPLAGKLRRKPDDHRFQLDCKAGDGVPFIRATAACTLSSLQYFDSADHLNAAYQLVPCCDHVDGREGYDPLALQVTMFACGGMTIGMAHSHSVCDGVGVSQFSRAMLELAFGKTKPTVIPVWERERLTFNGTLGEVVNFPKAGSFVATSSYSLHSYVATSSYSLHTDMVCEILNITSEDITKLKKTIAEDNEITNDEKEKKVVVTTLEILAAHVWRARCRASDMSPDETTVLGTAIGIRNIMEPPLPEGYYGNAVVAACVALPARELNESPLSRVVALVKDMKRVALDKRYVSGELIEIEKALEMEASVKSFDRGVMMLTDWRHIGLHYDGLVNVVPLIPKTMSYLCVLLPASKVVPAMSSGVRVMITLPRDVMAKFKEELYAF